MNTLNVACPINHLSYGIVSRNILSNLECDIRLKPIGQFDAKEFQLYTPDVNNFYLNTNLDDPSLRIFHEHSLFDHIGKGDRIGFPIFEKNRFNDFEKWNLHHQDLILVCSEWAKSVVEPINPNIHVCPLGVSSFFIQAATYQKKPKDKYIFYTQGKREKRKGHDVLHKMFHKAFENVDDVELWMFTQNPFDSPEETKNFQVEYKKLLGNKVKFFPYLQIAEMIKWLNQTDCGIFLSRAEGWNLPLLESMALGKDVIATYYSGHTEFLPDGIRPIEFEEAFDGKWFNGGFEWMRIEANEEEIIEKMREMYKLRNSTSNYKNVEIAKRYTWQNTAKEVHRGIFGM